MVSHMFLLVAAGLIAPGTLHTRDKYGKHMKWAYRHSGTGVGG